MDIIENHALIGHDFGKELKRISIPVFHHDKKTFEA